MMVCWGLGVEQDYNIGVAVAAGPYYRGVIVVVIAHQSSLCIAGGDAPDI